MRLVCTETDLPLEVHVPAKPPADPAGWATALVGAPELALSSHQTELGWPMLVGRTGDRTVALYRFVDEVAAIVIQGEATAALEVLASVRPSWRADDVVALVDLWGPPAE